MLRIPNPFYEISKKIKHLRGVAEEFVMGVHSNIPLCCVTHFCGHVLLHPKDESFGRRKSLKHGIAVGYVPCPTCVVKIKLGTQEAAKVHHCDPDDWKCRAVFRLMGCLELLEGKKYHPRKPEDKP